jgi:hypothetical protein
MGNKIGKPSMTFYSLWISYRIILSIYTKIGEQNQGELAEHEKSSPIPKAAFFCVFIAKQAVLFTYKTFTDHFKKRLGEKYYL